MEKKTIYETPELQILDLETEGALCDVTSGGGSFNDLENGPGIF